MSAVFLSLAMLFRLYVYTLKSVLSGPDVFHKDNAYDHVILLF